MSTRLFSLLLVGGLVVPQAIAAKDAIAGRFPRPADGLGGALCHCPLPRHNSVVELIRKHRAPPKVDILLGPKFESIELGVDQLAGLTALQTRDVSIQRSQ